MEYLVLARNPITLDLPGSDHMDKKGRTEYTLIGQPASITSSVLLSRCGLGNRKGFCKFVNMVLHGLIW